MSAHGNQQHVRERVLTGRAKPFVKTTVRSGPVPPSGQNSETPSQPSRDARGVVDREALTAMQREFDAAFFRGLYRDLCENIASTDASLLFAVYLGKVKSRACDPNADFSESAYLNANSDVKDALQAGSLLCGFEHWVRFGRKEGRTSAASRVGMADRNMTPDMQRLLEAIDCRHIVNEYGAILSLSTDADDIQVFRAYLENVREMQLDPNGQFSESYYLERNPDVKGSVKAGVHICGFHHWVVRGREEGRTHRPPGAWSDLIKPRTEMTDDKRLLFRNLFDAEFYTAALLSG